MEHTGGEFVEKKDMEEKMDVSMPESPADSGVLSVDDSDTPIKIATEVTDEDVITTVTTTAVADGDITIETREEDGCIYTVVRTDDGQEITTHMDIVPLEESQTQCSGDDDEDVNSQEPTNISNQEIKKDEPGPYEPTEVEDFTTPAMDSQPSAGSPLPVESNELHHTATEDSDMQEEHNETCVDVCDVQQTHNSSVLDIAPEDEAGDSDPGFINQSEAEFGGEFQLQNTSADFSTPVPLVDEPSEGGDATSPESCESGVQEDIAEPHEVTDDISARSRAAEVSAHSEEQLTIQEMIPDQVPSDEVASETYAASDLETEKVEELTCTTDPVNSAAVTETVAESSPLPKVESSPLEASSSEIKHNETHMFEAVCKTGSDHDDSTAKNDVNKTELNSEAVAVIESSVDKPSDDMGQEVVCTDVAPARIKAEWAKMTKAPPPHDSDEMNKERKAPLARIIELEQYYEELKLFEEELTTRKGKKDDKKKDKKKKSKS